MFSHYTSKTCNVWSARTTQGAASIQHLMPNTGAASDLPRLQSSPHHLGCRTNLGAVSNQHSLLVPVHALGKVYINPPMMSPHYTEFSLPTMGNVYVSAPPIGHILIPLELPTLANHLSTRIRYHGELNRTHSHRFWPAGEKAPQRYWPAGTTEQSWKSNQKKSSSIVVHTPIKQTKTKLREREEMERPSVDSPIPEVVSMCDVLSSVEMPPPGLTSQGAYWTELQTSLPNATQAFHTLLHDANVHSPTDISVNNNDPSHSLHPAVSDSEDSVAESIATHRSNESEENVSKGDSLADAFHDCVIHTQCRLQKKWNDWVSFEHVHGEMHGFVPRCQAELWDEWTGPEQIETCMAFAIAFENIGVMAIRYETNELCFRIKPIP